METLNEYCLRDIFSLLCFTEQLTVRRVCKTWNRIGNDFVSRVEELDIVGHPVPSNMKLVLARNVLHVREHIRTSSNWAQVVEKTISPLVSHFVSLRSLTIDCHGHSFSKSIVRSLENNCFELKSLTILNATNIQEELALIVSLEVLNLKLAFFESQETMCNYLKLSQLRSLQIMDIESDLTPETVAVIKQTVERFKLDCPFTGLNVVNGLSSVTENTRLTELRVPNLTNHQLNMICTTMVNLIAFSFKASIVDLMPLTQLTKLKKLHFSCQGLRSESEEHTLAMVLSRLDQLTDLSIEWPRAPTSTVATATTRCPNLRKLTITAIGVHRFGGQPNAQLLLKEMDS
ncbi:hypothetical protein HDE_01236 [Halotydeus destructor]|nr:hypothetical protein HDE_01236 [Halotydeus destructor]